MSLGIPYADGLQCPAVDAENLWVKLLSGRRPLQKRRSDIAPGISHHLHFGEAFELSEEELEEQEEPHKGKAGEDAVDATVEPGNKGGRGG